MLSLSAGSPLPRGATWDGKGTNFAVWSEAASAIVLCLDDRARGGEVRLSLRRGANGVFHGYVRGVGPGQRYGYRAEGPYAPQLGHRFNPNKLLLDPYARAVDGLARWHEQLAGFAPGEPNSAHRDERDSAAVAPRSLVIDPAFDWQGDTRPSTPWRDTVIYECHVKGLTALHPDVPPALRGRFLGLCSEPVIEHLRGLGVTAVELMPIMHRYDDEFLVAHGLCNYWGYDGISYFAPDARFSASPQAGAQVQEFKRMVQTLHRAGIEVILDVVYNHTGEGSELGPTLSLRGLDNAAYYQLEPGAPSRYANFTGCGHTLQLKHPETLRLVKESLHYFATEMHVDGFRFDLATALGRSALGLDLRGGLFAVLASDPVLSGLKLIMEPWDLAGVARGSFAGCSEWNDVYRDTVRRFWRGDGGQVGPFSAALSGSSHVFQSSARPPQASINFVTCHDGFTLRDLTSYDRRHNEANGWQGRDGPSDNWSCNFGIEGPSDERAITELRDRVARSMLATLACSLGVPMLLQGDELGHTQGGNNNPYGQDSATSWVSWELGPEQRALLTDARSFFALRRAFGVFRRGAYFDGNRVADTDLKDLTWLRSDGREIAPDEWRDEGRRALGALYCGHDDEGRPDPAAPSLLLLCNGGLRSTRFVLPSRGTSQWRIRLDTADRARVLRTIDTGAIDLAPGALCLLEETRIA